MEFSISGVKPLPIINYDSNFYLNISRSNCYQENLLFELKVLHLMLKLSRTCYSFTFQQLLKTRYVIVTTLLFTHI